MASLSGVSSSNTLSSLMNSANMISGLASGLDTEGMIESLVKSYQTKIEQLNQKVTKTEWKQDAYRSIISKLNNFSQKYTSYTSSTNLTSPSFFSNAVKVLTKGEFADSVTASGKTSSDISLDAVHQVARAAQYRTKSNLVTTDTGTIAGTSVDLFSEDPEKQIELSNLKGSLTLTYGTKTVSINFNETTDVDLFKDAKAKLEKEGKSAEDADVLAEVINQKLANQKIVFTNGSSESADQRIKATADTNGQITFTELGTAKNGVYISGASGNVGKQLGLSDDALKNAKDNKLAVINTDTIKGGENGGLTRKLSSFEYLAEQNGSVMNMSLNGTTKQITMPKVEYKEEEVEGEDGNKTTQKIYYINDEKVKEGDFANKYTEALQKSVQDAFKGKVKVENKGENGELKLEFKVNEGDDLIINSDVGDALGIGNIATSYLNTSKTLKDLMGGKLSGLEASGVDEKTGKAQYDFTINGVKIGTYTEDTKLSTILSDINSNKEAGVSVSYSQTTQNFTFKAKETGADSKIEMGEGLAQAIFGSTSEPMFNDFGMLVDNEGNKISGIDASGQKYYVAKLERPGTGEFLGYYIADEDGAELSDEPMLYDASEPRVAALLEKSRNGYTAGQDAVFTATINGEQKTMTRSSNSVSIDGLTINMNETFNSKVDEDGKAILDSNGKFQVDNTRKSVTFQSKTDSDKIIDAIKSMVSDYNTMMSEVKSAYSTMPYQKSSGSFANYEPLTEEDRSGMSESAIERYEEKAKQGILFGDRDLSNLYTKMNQAFSFSRTSDIDTLKEMGISISYNISDGAQAVTIDEDKLRAMLDSDPDRVADLFTKTDGVMDRMKTQLDTYARTTGEPKGILIQQAGSPLSSLSLMSNAWQKEIDNYNTQIEKWQDKLTKQVERYQSQFTRLEQLINQMNSQSSTLQGLMGG